METSSSTRPNRLDFVATLLSAAYLLFGLIESFTFNQFHIYSRPLDFSAMLYICELLKMAGYLLVPMAVFLNSAKAKSILKIVYPLVAVFSLLGTAEYCSMEKTMENTPNRNNLDPVTMEIYDSINQLIPKGVIWAIYVLQAFALLLLCAHLLLRDGLGKKEFRSIVYLPLFVLACIPLNVLSYPLSLSPSWLSDFLRFENFSFWHFLSLALVPIFTLLAYLILKRKTKERRLYWLRVMAIILLIHFAGKDSMLIGDGYNIYNIALSSIPLFICDIGKIIVFLALFLNKKRLYDIAFFVHSAGAVTVFFYFGRIQNFGAVIDYSFAYFTLTHLLLFLLSVLPVMLGLSDFKVKDVKIPLVYYAFVILVATFTSVLITNLSATWVTNSGEHLSELLYLNFAFTQICPLPIDLPGFLTVNIGECEVDFLYLILLYLAYVAIFFAFFGFTLLVALSSKKLAKRQNAN